jgi:hypothetical protein
MNMAPTVGPLMAELLSGFTVLLLAYFDLYGVDFDKLKDVPNAGIVVLVLLAWILGTFFDLIRNLFENLWDCHWLTKHELNWAFFLYGDDKKLANLEHYFWSFYILDADMVVAILFFLLLGRWILSVTVGPAHAYPISLHVVLLVIAAMFALDAGLLRSEIKKLLVQ